MQPRNFSIYWLHLEEHSDPFNEGYIGYSGNVTQRLRNHKRNKSNKLIVENIAECVCTILNENLDLDDARNIEIIYRPAENIGWNIDRGGKGRVSGPKKKKVRRYLHKLQGANRTYKQQAASADHSIRMKGKTPWNKGLVGVQLGINKGKVRPHLREMANLIRTCPYCNKSGKGSSMLRWHFENCKNG